MSSYHVLGTGNMGWNHGPWSRLHNLLEQMKEKVVITHHSKGHTEANTALELQTMGVYAYLDIREAFRGLDLKTWAGVNQEKRSEKGYKKGWNCSIRPGHIWYKWQSGCWRRRQNPDHETLRSLWRALSSKQVPRQGQIYKGLSGSTVEDRFGWEKHGGSETGKHISAVFQVRESEWLDLNRS